MKYQLSFIIPSEAFSFNVFQEFQIHNKCTHIHTVLLNEFLRPCYIIPLLSVFSLKYCFNLQFSFIKKRKMNYLLVHYLYPSVFDEVFLFFLLQNEVSQTTKNNLVKFHSNLTSSNASDMCLLVKRSNIGLMIASKASPCSVDADRKS